MKKARINFSISMDVYFNERYTAEQIAEMFLDSDDSLCVDWNRGNFSHWPQTNVKKCNAGLRSPTPFSHMLE